MLMSAKMAETCARLAWEAFVRLTSSEVAAQETIGGTPKDFEMFALRYLIQSFLTGQTLPLGARIDTTKGHAAEDITGEYHYAKLENLQVMTYVQAMEGLREQVPAKYRQTFKRKHAAGATPYQAYMMAMEQWDKDRRAIGGE